MLAALTWPRCGERKPLSIPPLGAPGVSFCGPKDVKVHSGRVNFATLASSWLQVGPLLSVTALRFTVSE